MKINWFNIIMGLGAIAALTFVLSFDLPDQRVSAILIGQWHSDATNIAVREKMGFMKYKFVREEVVVQLEIINDSTAQGSIGNATFSGARMKRNEGNPDRNGIATIIKCGPMDALFTSDNTGTKMIELWIKPQHNTDELIAEIRLIDGWDTFPMGECVMKRQSIAE